MRLCTVRERGGEPFLALAMKSELLRLADAVAAYRFRPAQRALFADMQAYLDGWPRSEKHARKLLSLIAEDPAPLAAKTEAGDPYLVPASKVEFLPPVTRPGKILCVGLNYRDHCEEQGKSVPDYPLLFNKYRTSLRGHGADIPLPLDLDDCMDYEGELAFVVGKEATRVKKRSAMSHIAGFMVMNDVSARTLQKNERQWARAKGCDGSAPCGPYLVSADEVGDPHNLAIRTRVNGNVMQSSNTKHFIFNLPYLVQYITAAITLEPGDIVTTGTPGGVGVFREPPVFLDPGDEVEIEIERVGILRNTCVKR